MIFIDPETSGYTIKLPPTSGLGESNQVESASLRQWIFFFFD